MKRLLALGAGLGAKTTDGDTPLSLAISAGSVGAVGFLVKEGAALGATDKVKTLTPLLTCWLPTLNSDTNSGNHEKYREAHQRMRDFEALTYGNCL